MVSVVRHDAVERKEKGKKKPNKILNEQRRRIAKGEKYNGAGRRKASMPVYCMRRNGGG